MNKIKKRQSNFTQVSNTFLRDHRISFKAKGLFCYMYSMDEEWNFTLQSIAKQQNDGVGSIQSAMKELKEFGYISYEKHYDGTGTYTLNDNPNIENPNIENPNMENPNMENPNMENPNMENGSVLSNNNPKEEKEVRITINKSIYVEIVNHLNQTLNTKYSYKSKGTQKLINAILNNGFTKEDFFKVHIIKFADPKMQKYLRPETLYGTKFESYLNQKITDYEKMKAINAHTGMSALDFLKQQGYA